MQPKLDPAGAFRAVTTDILLLDLVLLVKVQLRQKYYATKFNPAGAFRTVMSDIFATKHFSFC